jgi:hypothetical protein
VKRLERLERLLRWYPTSWRERYGEEFLALLEDELDGAKAPLLFRVKIALAGVRERFLASGVVGTTPTAETRRRAGSLLVLVAWAGMVVGGVGLAKSAEHFSNSLAPSARAGAQFAYDLVVGAGAAGSLLVVLGALIGLPAFARFLVAGGARRVRPALVRALAASAVTGAGVVALGTWAHRLNVAQRNGVDAGYVHAFLAVAVLAVVTIGLWTAFVVKAATAMSIPPVVLRVESELAGAVAAATALVFVGSLAWWLEVGTHAPWFFRASPVGVAVSFWSTPMELNMGVMALSTVLALWGVARLASARREYRASTSL